MASDKKSRAVRNARSSVGQERSVPWSLIAGTLAVLVVAGVVFGYVYQRWSTQQTAAEAVAAYRPTTGNPDPSKNIPGVEIANYRAGQHVRPGQRVAYDKAPPFGGPHDGVWAACTGVVYPTPVRNENMVHSLEHGAVWIAYNPDVVKGAALDQLTARADGKPYTMASPYPGLDRPISLQSWGHRLKVDRADDPRIDQFITALRQNDHGVYPEVGGSCQAYPGAFDPQRPPPFEPGPPPPGAVTMDGKGVPNGP
jgi:hypothetical protein